MFLVVKPVTHVSVITLCQLASSLTLAVDPLTHIYLPAFVGYFSPSVGLVIFVHLANVMHPSFKPFFPIIRGILVEYWLLTILQSSSVLLFHFIVLFHFTFDLAVYFSFVTGDLFLVLELSLSIVRVFSVMLLV